MGNHTTVFLVKSFANVAEYGVDGRLLLPVKLLDSCLAVCVCGGRVKSQALVFLPILTCGHESWVMTEEYYPKCKRRWGFCEKLKSSPCDTSQQTAELRNSQNPEC